MKGTMKRILDGGVERVKVAVDILGALSKRCTDYLLQPNEWQTNVGDPIATATRVENPSQLLSLTDRSVSQLSERLGAGTFLPGLLKRYNNGSDEKEKEILRHLFAYNTNMLKMLLKNPLLFRISSTEDGTSAQVRAVLSNQYVVLNNYDLLLSCLETVKRESDKNEVPIDQIKFDYEADDDYSDIRFYFVNDYIRFDDNYRGGIVVKNGECGDMSFEVTLMLFNTNCCNVIRTQIKHGLRHTAERVFRYSDMTNRMQAEVVYRKASEMTRVLFSRSEMQRYYDMLIKAKNILIDQDKAQVIMKRYFSQERVSAILDLWRAKEEPNLYGLAQAITFNAQEQSFAQRERDEEFASHLLFA